MRTRRPWIVSLLVLIATASAVSAPAQPSAPPAAQAPAAQAAPAPSPASAPSADGALRVTLDMRDESVRDVLDAIAEQTGLSLIITNPEAADEHQVALRVKNMPIDELLPTLAAESGLTIEHRGSALVVSGSSITIKHRGHHKVPRPPAPPAPPGGSERSFSVDLGPNGEHRVTGNITIDVDADERFGMGSDVRVEAHQTVSEATVIGGTLTVLGHVEGDAVAVGGSVHLEPGAVVDGDVVAVAGWITAPAGVQIGGDAVSVGGMVQTDPGTSISGDRIQVGGRLGGVMLGLVGLAGGAPLAFSIAMMLVRVAVLFGAGVLLISYWPTRVANVRGFLTRRPGLSVLGGVALVVGVLPVCFVLLLTVVGIPLIPLVLTAFVLLYLVGTTAIASWIGERLPFLADRKTPVIAVLLGLGLITLVKLVPLFGSLLVVLVATVAAGAALLSRVGQPAAAPPVAPPVAPPAPPATTDITSTPASN